MMGYKAAKTSHVFAVALTVVAALVLTACGGGEPLNQASVRLNPELIKAQAAQEIVVSVDVVPGGRGISGGEINLSFDSRVLSLVSVSAGELLGPSPLIGAETVDSQAGTLLYALARRGSTAAPTPKGALAQITFRVAENAARGRYPITLTKVGLADESFRDISNIAVAPSTVEI